MKLFKKIIMISAMLLLLVHTASFAAMQPEEAPKTNYNIISQSDQEKIKEFITIKEGYEKFCIIEGVALIVVLIMILKTHAIEGSTKTILTIAMLAVASYIIQFSVEGNIIPILEVFVQILGVVLFILSALFIYKHDNLLIYIPIYALLEVYAFREIQIIQENIILEMALIIAPVILLVLGKIVGIGKEKALLRPVKEKHEKKKEE